MAASGAAAGSRRRPHRRAPVRELSPRARDGSKRVFAGRRRVPHGGRGNVHARTQHEGGEIGGSPEDALLAAERECPTLAVIDLRGLDFMDSTRLNELVRARRARAEQRRVVRVMGTQPIDRILAVSGVERAFETTRDPATLDPLRP